MKIIQHKHIILFNGYLINTSLVCMTAKLYNMILMCALKILIYLEK